MTSIYSITPELAASKGQLTKLIADTNRAISVAVESESELIAAQITADSTAKSHAESDANVSLAESAADKEKAESKRAVEEETDKAARNQLERLQRRQQALRDRIADSHVSIGFARDEFVHDLAIFHADIVVRWTERYIDAITATRPKQSLLAVLREGYALQAACPNSELGGLLSGVTLPMPGVHAQSLIEGPRTTSGHLTEAWKQDVKAVLIYEELRPILEVQRAWQQWQGDDERRRRQPARAAGQAIRNF